MWDLISGAQLDEYLDQGSNVFLVDMRDANSYRRAHIRGAVNIPAGLASLGYETADVYGGIQAYRGRYLDWGMEA